MKCILILISMDTMDTSSSETSPGTEVMLDINGYQVMLDINGYILFRNITRDRSNVGVVESLQLPEDRP